MGTSRSVSSEAYRSNHMERWREAVLEVLGDIADVDAQRASWIRGAGRPIPDPIELACQLFDDTDLGARLSTGLVFSRECDQMLRRLGELLEAPSLERTPAAVLKSRKWREIVSLARSSLDCINAL